MENKVRLLMISIMSFIIIGLGLYILVGMVLSKANKQKFGVETPMAWFPIVNIYLIGKISSSKTMGWLLLIGLVLTCEWATVDGTIKRTVGFMPQPYRLIFNYAIIGVIVMLFLKIVYDLMHNSYDKKDI